MIDALLLGFALAATSPPADTIVELRRGDRVVIENLSGEISVVGWDRDVLEVRGEDRDDVLVVQRTGSTVRVTVDRATRRRRSIEASIRVPTWVDLEIGGRSLDLSVRELKLPVVPCCLRTLAASVILSTFWSFCIKSRIRCEPLSTPI